VATQFADILDEVQTQRQRPRPAVVVWAAVVAGVLFALAGAALCVIFPEGGIPLLLIGLRLLALRFAWAAVAYARVRWWWVRFVAWWRSRSRALRWSIIIGVTAIVTAVTWWLAA
jgi:uncharacterized membrane protein